MPNPKPAPLPWIWPGCRNQAGKVEFRVDKTGVLHVPVGKAGFQTDKLLENAQSLIQAVLRAKPAAAKGKFVRSVTICSTMGPGSRSTPPR
jgi:large subunit ribosomal protein L1